MIRVDEAKKLIAGNNLDLGKETLPLDKAANKFLANNITSPIQHPLFHQTAVDGYCFNFKSLDNNCLDLKLVAEIKAGDKGDIQLSPGECSRIFTGAPICDGADTIVMQEDVTIHGDKIRITKSDIQIGANLRKAGEQIKEGELALAKGTMLNPAAIGFLASLGINKVRVFRSPKVHIIITGNEFTTKKKDILHGKIYESNGKMLKAGLNKIGVETDYKNCSDSFEQLSNSIKHHENLVDILLITGGVSVGDYDFTRSALEANSFDIIFHKVWQKPGKPLLFAKKGDKFAFGLPGNPRAVLICFYYYILPFIRNAMGDSNADLLSIKTSLAHDYKRKDDGKVHFLAGNMCGRKAEVLFGQGSHMLKSLTESNILIKLSENEIQLKEGAPVNAYLIP